MKLSSRDFISIINKHSNPRCPWQCYRRGGSFFATTIAVRYVEPAGFGSENYQQDSLKYVSGMLVTGTDKRNRGNSYLWRDY